MKYVNIYLIDRAYGGPEEGGWWYEYGIPYASYPALDESQLKRLQHQAHNLCDTLNAEGNRDLNSVACEGRYTVKIEPFFAKPWPDVHPHYE